MKLLIPFILILGFCFPVLSQTPYTESVKGEWVLHSVVSDNSYMEKVVTQIENDETEIAVTIDDTHFMVNGNCLNRFWGRLDDTVRYRIESVDSATIFLFIEDRYASKKKRWKIGEILSIAKLNDNELALRKLFHREQDVFSSRSSMIYYFRRKVKDSTTITPFSFEGDWHVCGITLDTVWTQDTIIMNREFCNYERKNKPDENSVYERAYRFSGMVCFRTPVDNSNYWYTQHPQHPHNFKSGEEWYVENEKILVVKDENNKTYRFTYSFNSDILMLVKVGQ